MELKSKILLHLYGEETDPKDLARLLQDEETRLEYEALGEVKDLLDNQSGVRPRAEVIDTIVAEAMRRHPGPQVHEPEQTEADRPSAAPVLKPRSDRAARRSQRRSMPAIAGALATMVLLVGLGWWHFSAEGPLLPDAFSTEEVASEEAATDRLDQGTAAAAEDVELIEIPSWDESDAFRRLRRQMEFVQSRSSEDAWGEPVIPLEMRDHVSTSPTLTSVQR